MTDFLFYGDTERSAAMRHELPVAIGDAFLLGVVGGRRHIVVNSLERGRVEAATPDAVLHDIADLGFHDLLQSGKRFFDIDLELASRGAAAMGIREAVVDPEMPVAVADRLRADGLVLRPDDVPVAARRRVKTPAEIAGVRRAQAAAEAGMAAAAALLRSADLEGERLVAAGEPVTAEAVRAVLREECRRHGAPAPPDVIVSSVWQGTGHDPGSGPLPANLPIVIDVWPQDEESACWGDMTRTFVVGEVSPAVRGLASLVGDALERARKAVRPGVLGRELHAIVCDVFEAAGHRTQRTGPGDDPEAGFQFSLGHGVGLAVHEAPSLGLAGVDALVAGDVVAMEPGLWVRGIGEVRFEDLLLVTGDGAETLNRYPFDLAP
ncbi:MAG TPA: M24 family metallopeptidase [Gaiellales bacterium]